MEIKESELIEYWGSSSSFVYEGKDYRVGRMSYGDFFLEPGESQGETKPFNKGTLWLKLFDPKKCTYEVDYELGAE